METCPFESLDILYYILTGQWYQYDVMGTCGYVLHWVVDAVIGVLV